MEDNGYFIKSLIKKHAPFNILAMLMSVIAPLVCTALAGVHFGSGGLAIMAICAPLFFAASFFGFIISGGGQILCSQFIAKDELDNVNKVYSAVYALTLLLDILMCAALFIFKTPLLTLLAGEITPELSAYYNIFVFNAFAVMLIYIPIFLCKTAGKPQIGLLTTGIMALVSCVLSFVFIGFMGIEGIALAQAAGTGTALIVSVIMLGQHFKLVLPKKLFIKQIFTLGSPGGLTRLYILLTTLVLNMLFLNIGGIEALAVFGVVATLHRFTGAVIIGTSQTLIPLVGVFHEEQDITSIKQTIKYIFFYGNILMFVFGALYCVFGAGIAALFGLPADSGFAAVMPPYAVYCILLLNATVFSSYYNAIKELFLANIIVLLQEFALLCGAALFLAVSFDFGRIWFAFPASSVLTFTVLFALLLIRRIKSKENTAFLLLNRNLQKNGKYISFSIDSGPEHISEAAAKIGDFCEESGLPLEETMLISMSVEEIVTLITGNSKNKSFSVSVRLFLFDGGIVLRIRNTGEKFDVIEYYKSNIADDIEKSLDVLGMKYIVETAKVIYYRQTFGVNNLVVII